MELTGVSDDRLLLLLDQCTACTAARGTEITKAATFDAMPLPYGSAVDALENALSSEARQHVPCAALWELAGPTLGSSWKTYRSVHCTGVRITMITGISPAVEKARTPVSHTAWNDFVSLVIGLAGCLGRRTGSKWRAAVKQPKCPRPMAASGV